MALLKPGDKAPDFRLLDQNGTTFSLANFKGRKLLLYFYPKADTPGCTTQSCSVRDAMADMRRLDMAVVGVSPDPPEDQKKFDDKYKLGFPLLSDKDHKLAEAFGVWDANANRNNRSAFLIDEQGRILEAWYGVRPEETVPKAMDAVHAAARK